MFTKLLAIAVAVMGLSLAAPASLTKAYAKTDFITIGTGGITGVYYPVGGAIAKILNNHKDIYGLRATAEASGASVYNIAALMSREMDFAFAQADCQYQAYSGLSEWAGRPQKDLRAVFSLAPEMVTLVVAANSDIYSLADLKGKAVNIGNLGSGNRQNSIDVLWAAGFDYQTDLSTVSIKAADAPRLVQDGRLDGFFYTVGHPNNNIREATSGQRKVRIVPIPDLMTLPEKFPYYIIADIDMSQYPGAANVADGKVPTVAMLATMVTSSSVPDDVVYRLTKAVFENLKELKAMHPALRDLTPKGMLQGHTAPLHPGAVKYYKEVGLM